MKGARSRLAAAVIALLRFWREFRHFGLRLAISRQHPLETGVERLGDIGPLLEAASSIAAASMVDRPSRRGSLRSLP
jgi:hypothetical protein